VVIHHFNRLIKNKWVWGVFAVAISVFFAFDFLFRGDSDGGRSSSGAAGKLGGKDVPGTFFNQLVNDVRGFGRGRDNTTPAAEVNRKAWQNAAALAVAKSANLEATDEDVRAAIRRERAFQNEGGAFDNDRYKMLLGEAGMSPEMFEDQLKRRITLNKLQQVVLGSAAWASPAELETAINDVTDKFTVRVAAFTDKDASKVTIDDKGIEAYYKDNTNSIALPDCVTVKFARFDAASSNRLAQFTIAAEEVSNHWDVVQDESRFKVTTKKGTNTVTEVMSLEKAWPMVERDLKLAASLEAYRTNLLFRVYPQDDKALDPKVDRLEKIAAEEKVKVETSKPFALDGRGFVKGFMVRANQIAPGCDGFSAAVAELDPDSAELRYGVVAGKDSVYLVERVSFIKAHVPTFAEAKEHIRADALADAKKKAFKANVEKTRALVAAELAKGKPFDEKMFAGATVSTQIVFSVATTQYNSFADSSYVSRGAMKLAKGQLSDFITTASPTRGLVVYVVDRTPGDASQVQMVRAQLRDELSRGAMMTLPAAWQEWNLNRMGFEPADFASVKASDEAAGSED